MQNKIITSFFCLLLAVSALIGLLMPDRYYSEREKRSLTQKPKFTVADFISGEFNDELGKVSYRSGAPAGWLGHDENLHGSWPSAKGKAAVSISAKTNI